MNRPYDLYQIDKTKVRESFDRAAASYDDVAILQREVGNRLLERLDLIKLQPQRILDLGAGTGVCSLALAQRYRQAQVISLDLALAMLLHARRRLPLLDRWFGKHSFVCADAEQLPLADNSIDLIFSNLTLQWCTDLDRTFSEFQRILRPGGTILFSTFGPDTLKELRQSWAQIDSDVHVNAFIDMHDIGDAMMRARLSDPVMDSEYLTLTYSDITGAMRDLKAMGAHNINAGRPRTLTGKTRLQQLATAYEQFRRADGTLPVSYEVVYGHAWGNHLQADGTVHVSLDQLRQGRR